MLARRCDDEVPDLEDFDDDEDPDDPDDDPDDPDDDDVSVCNAAQYSVIFFKQKRNVRVEDISQEQQYH